LRGYRALRIFRKICFAIDRPRAKHKELDAKQEDLRNMRMDALVKYHSTREITGSSGTVTSNNCSWGCGPLTLVSNPNAPGPATDPSTGVSYDTVFTSQLGDILGLLETTDKRYKYHIYGDTSLSVFDLGSEIATVNDITANITTTPLPHFSPPASAQWACSGGAGSGRRKQRPQAQQSCICRGALGRGLPICG
jgi:hypothetical protein